MTKQIIFGDDFVGGAAGAITFEDQAGTVLVNAAAVIAAKTFRVLRFGSNVKSQWINQKDIINTTTATGAVSTAQIANVTLTEDATTPDVGYFKLIDTSAGMEPFNRKTYEIPLATIGGAANAIAVYLAAAITADMPSWISAATAPGAGVLTVTGTTFAGMPTDTVMTNIQIAFDPGTSVATCTVPALTAGSVGVGDVEVMLIQEKNFLGSGVGDYDRATYLPNGTVTYASAGFPYELNTITYKNPTVNQINGVDNERVLVLAVRNSAVATAPAAALVDAIVAGI